MNKKTHLAIIISGVLSSHVLAGDLEMKLPTDGSGALTVDQANGSEAFRIDADGKATIKSGLQIPAGAGIGKVLTSDGSGNATWQMAGDSDTGWDHIATDNIDMASYAIANADLLQMKDRDGSGNAAWYMDGDIKLWSGTVGPVLSITETGKLITTALETNAITAASIKVTTGAVDGYVLTSDASGQASWKAPTLDNLGNHTATQALDMAGFDVNGVGLISVSSLKLSKPGDGNSPVNSTSANLNLIESTSNSSSTGFYLKSKNSMGEVRDIAVGIDPNSHGGVFALNKGDGSNYVAVALESGNVGIGRSNPAEKLEVNGSIKLSGGISGLRSADSIAGTSHLTLHANSDSVGSAEEIKFKIAGSEVASVKPDGKVVAGGLQIDSGKGDGKVLTSDAEGNASWQDVPSSADNLGDHKATQDIDIGGFGITNVDRLEMKDRDGEGVSSWYKNINNTILWNGTSNIFSVTDEGVVNTANTIRVRHDQNNIESIGNVTFNANYDGIGTNENFRFKVGGNEVASIQDDGKVVASGLQIALGKGEGKILTSDAEGNASWQSAPSGADNMGNHTATQTIDAAGFAINNADAYQMKDRDGSGVSAWYKDGQTALWNGTEDIFRIADNGNVTVTGSLGAQDGVRVNKTGVGTASLLPGNAEKGGYFQVNKADGTVLGWIGHDATDFRYAARSGARHYMEGNVIANSEIRAGADGEGHVKLVRGNSSGDLGHMSIHKPDGTRVGYIGAGSDETSQLYVVDDRTNAKHEFKGRIRVQSSNNGVDSLESVGNMTFHADIDDSNNEGFDFKANNDRIINIDSLGAMTVGREDHGRVRISPAAGEHSGYIGFRKADNTRLGYIGFDENHLTYVVENDAQHRFNGTTVMSSLVTQTVGDVLTTGGLLNGDSAVLTPNYGDNWADAREFFVVGNNSCNYSYMSKFAMVGGNFNNAWRLKNLYAFGMSGDATVTQESVQKTKVTFGSANCQDKKNNYSYEIMIDSTGKLTLTNLGSDNVAFEIRMNYIR